MTTLKQMAKWKSTMNPLDRVLGAGSISQCLMARGQDDNCQMILYSPDLLDTTNVRWMFEDERTYKTETDI